MVDTLEKLGPAERIIQTILAYTDHLYHGRPGVVVPDTTSNVGVKWSPVTHKVEENLKVVYRLDKIGNKTNKVRIGVMQDDLRILENGREVGIYRPAGLFPEVAAWMYRQVAEVWRLDNEFAAHWASYAFGQEHRDLKVVLAAFMLCQTRKGEPVLGDDGKIAFNDEDFRDVGEAMILIDKKDKHLDAKHIARIYEFLSLSEIATINRELGFGRSTRRPFYGRWEKAVDKWIEYRELNPKMLEGLVEKGFRTTVMDLARRIRYKPDTSRFFQILRWKQSQAEDGRRTFAIGEAVAAADTWEGLTEEQICERIVTNKPNFKRIVGLLPKSVGVTRAIVAAAIEAGSLSNKDLIIATPTLEELGLLEVQYIREKWEKAVKSADDMRAANIAQRVKSKEVKDSLETGADTALQKQVEEVVRNIRVYLIVDTSGSMEGAIEAAKQHLARFAQGFPLDKLHVSVFNTMGREIKIAHASKAGVENAFRGITAGGGTDYGSGIRALQQYKIVGQDEDRIFIFVGDEGNQGGQFASAVRVSGLEPVAFGLVPIVSPRYGRGTAVRDTANALGIPCFEIDERTFADPYAIPRTIRALIAATPVGVRAERVAATPRVSLVEMILKTELLKKPAWAA